jgi:hypothetical protein
VAEHILRGGIEDKLAKKVHRPQSICWLIVPKLSSSGFLSSPHFPVAIVVVDWAAEFCCLVPKNWWLALILYGPLWRTLLALRSLVFGGDGMAGYF